MSGKLRRSVCCVASLVVLAYSCQPQTTQALDTANTLMAVDGMTILHAGLFRNGTPNDGFNTFQFGAFATAAASLGRYHSFYLVKTGDGACCISHRNRIETFTPEVFVDTDYTSVSGAQFSIDSDYFPVIDRAAFGQVFDPEDYQIEVTFKPNMGVTGIPDNVAPTLSVSLDQHYGFVWDEEVGRYKRASEQIFFNFGDNDETTTMPSINDWYASAEKDADGFATMKIPILENAGSARSYYYNYGDGDFRNAETLSGGGRTFDTETSAWEDVNVGYTNYQYFGGGPSDPNNPGSKLDTPNGFSLMAFGAPDNMIIPLSVEIKDMAVTKINPGPIVARIDAYSGLSYRFGSGFTLPQTAPPINLDGFPMVPRATDQISRFDENGFTNLIFNMRTPDNTGEVHRFVIRNSPGGTPAFDGNEAVVNIRARLTEALGSGQAEMLQIVAKDLDGDDNASDPVGADEYTYNLDLHLFNTNDFTTISIPMSDFTLSDFVPTTTEAGSGPFGFMNPGDGLLTDFNIYEFGGLIPADSGLLKLELEYLEIRLPGGEGLPGDFDGDGDVDGHDYLVWQRNPAVGNLSDWETNYGMGSQLAVANAVPEPSSLFLAVCGVTLLGRRRVQFSHSAI